MTSCMFQGLRATRARLRSYIECMINGLLHEMGLWYLHHADCWMLHDVFRPPMSKIKGLDEI